MKSLNPNCEQCPLHKTATTVCMPAEGTEKPKILLVAAYPGAAEDKAGRPLMGEGGKILRDQLNQTQLNSSTLITHLVKCRPPGNRPPNAKEIKACRPYLEEEIERYKPKYVVTTGVLPTKTLFRGKAKITQFHGEIIQNPKVDYIGMPIFDPAFTLRDPSKLPALKDDINRLARLMRGGLRNHTVHWRVVRNGNIDQFLREFEEADQFAFDCETSGLFPFDPEGYVTAIAIALPHQTWVIPGRMHEDFQQFSHSPFKKRARLRWLMRKVFEIARRTKKRSFAQNGKFDTKWMRCQFGDSFRLTFDIMLAHHVIDENLDHDLTSMCRTYLDEPEYDVSLDVKQGKSKKPMINYQYCARDATYTLRLGNLFEEMLRKQPDLHRLFWKLVMPGARAMVDAEMEGLPFDPVARKKVGLELLSKKITLFRELNEMVGQDINWNSPQQIAKLLFKDLGIPSFVKTPKGADSTSEEALAMLRGTHEVADKLLDYRSADKFFNTYIKGWNQYRVGNRYYFDYKLHGTKTGRYSSPLHPIPRDGSIRNLVTSDEEGWTFFAMDIKTAEMCIAAHLSHDEEMIRCFSKGIDVHWRTMIENLAIGTQGDFAKLVIPTAQEIMAQSGDDPEHIENVGYTEALDVMLAAGPKECIAIEPKWYEGRTRSKCVNFGFIYGMWEKKFIEQAKKDYNWEPTISEAKSVRAAYFQLYNRLEEWHRKTKKLARLSGYVRCLTGRLRRLPGIQSKDKYIRSEAERQAINSGVQGFIGDYKVMILIEIHQTMPRDKVRLLGEHHDAVLGKIRNDCIDEICPKLLKMVERPRLMDTFKINLSVPMEGEIELGPWGNGVKYAA
jgi:uracil-DNA glycosylase family 4